MAKRISIKNETIPNASKILGQSSMAYKAGGAYATSFNSTDLFNFDVKDEGEVTIKDPQRSYLTTTFYPLTFIDYANVSCKTIPAIQFTDNLYANHGDIEEYQTSALDVAIVTFKVALIVRDYYSNSFAPRDTLKVEAKRVTMTLRDVLRLYSLKEQFRVAGKAITYMNLRSVLIKYEYYKPENIFLSLTKVEKKVDTQYSNRFTSYLVGDSIYVSTVKSDKVQVVKDLAQLSWNTPTTLTVTASAKAGDQALIIDEGGEGITSNESIGISTEEGVEVMFENWFKPSLSTTSLLTTYGNTSNKNEVPNLEDKIGDQTSWVNFGTGYTETETFNLTQTDYLTKNVVSTDTSFLATNPITTNKGTTMELNCTVTGTDRVYLISNGSTALTAAGNSFSVVWYGASTVDATLQNRVAIISDDTTLKDANNHLIVSQRTYPTGSSMQICVIFYGLYIKLFIDGILQGVKLVNRDFNIAYNNKIFLGKANWYTYTTAHTYSIQSFRFTKMALYLENSYTTTDPFKFSVIPNINKLGAATKYATGVTCGLRYKDADNTVRAFAAITDAYDTTFTVESQPIDASKWNYIQLANTGSDITLFINGLASNSMTLPYNLRFKEVTLSSKDASNFKGYLDNFRIYSKVKDTSNFLKTSDLFFTVNDLENTDLTDSNPDLKWTKLPSSVISTGANAYRDRYLTGGLYTNNASLLMGSQSFELQTVSNFKSYKASDITLATDVAISSDTNYATAFSLGTNALRIKFNLNSTTATKLLEISLFSILLEASDSKVKATVKINSALFELPGLFTLGTTYDLVICRIAGSILFYLDGILISNIKSSADIQSGTITIGTFIGNIVSLQTSNVTDSTELYLDNKDYETSQGLQVYCYELFSNKFVLTATFDTVNRAYVDSLISSGVHKVSTVLKNKTLYFKIDGVESEKLTNVSFLEGSGKLSIFADGSSGLNTLSFDLIHFECTSSQQDALLSTVYNLTKLENETIFKNAIFALSSDSDYTNMKVFDRNSNVISKDILNINNVTKAMRETGFYFTGTSYLKTKASDDFVFGTGPFYMEFEVKTNVKSRRQVILDRYFNGAGSWQVSIHTNGHLYFTITNSNSTPYSFNVDVSTVLNDGKWHKVQIDRLEKVYKFYVDGEEVYEYATETLLNFNSSSQDLYIGYQGNVPDASYYFQGYLNNLRIVKGASINQDLSDGDSDLIAETVLKIKEDILNEVVTNAIELRADGLPYTIDLENNLVRVQGGDTYTWSKQSAGGLPYSVSSVLADDLTEACNLFIDSLDYITSYDYVLTGVTPNGSNGTCHIRINSEGTTNYVNDNNTDLVRNGVVAKPDILITFTELAEDLIKLANLGDSAVKVFLGVSRNLAEDYTTEKVSSSTILHLTSVNGVLYDPKYNTWTQNSVTFTSGATTRSSEWINVGSSLESDVAMDFTEDSDFTIEANIAITGKTAYDRPLLQSVNKDTSAKLFELGVLSNNTGLYFDVVSEGTTIRRQVNIKLQSTTWYRIALCQILEQMHFYVNNNKYSCEPLQSKWDTASNYRTKVLGLGMYLEVLKVSNECTYFINKGKDNQLLSNHLIFENNLRDSGNNPTEWTASLFGISTVETPKETLGSMVMASDITLTAANVLTSVKEPFTLNYIAKFTSNAEETITTFSNSECSFRLFKTAANTIKVSIIAGEEEIIATENTTVLSGWNTITISRDYSNVLSIAVNGIAMYVGGFGYDITNTNFTLGGFTGYLYDFKVYNSYVADHVYSTNILKLDFEKDSVINGYALEKAKDKSLTANNVAVIKGLSQTSDNVLYFDGVSSYMTMQDNPWVNLAKEQFEITFSIYPSNGQNAYQTIFSVGHNVFSVNSAYIMMYGNTQPSHVVAPASNRIAIGLGWDIAENPILLCNSQITYNAWNHIKIARTKTELQIYLNGVLDNSVAMDKDFNFNVVGLTYFGKNAWDGANGYFQGYLDDFKISMNGSYREASVVSGSDGIISAVDFEDVGTVYDIVESGLTSSLDSYGNAWTGAVYNNTVTYKKPVFKTVSAINDAILFEGRGYLYCHNKHFAVGLNPFTVSMDFCQTARNTDNSIIFQQYGLYSGYITPAGILYLSFGGTSVNLGLVNLDKWYTIAITRDTSNTLRVFLDGKIKSTVANHLVNYNYGTGTVYPMCLGTDYYYRDHPSYVGRYFTGYIDNFLFERDYCRYTENYLLYVDKTERRISNSIFEVKTSGVTSFTDIANPQLTWSSSGITTVTDTTYTTFAGKSTSTSGYSVSSAHSWALEYQDFTIDLIVKPMQILAETCILDMTVSSATTEGIQVIQPVGNTSSLSVRLATSGSSEWELTLNSGINTISTSKAYHLRVCRNLGTIYLYLDGVLKASSDYTPNITIGSTITLFNNKGRTKGYTGNIEQFRFLKGHSLSGGGSFAPITESFK